MMMRSVIFCVMAGVLVAGCTAREDRILFDGQYFRAKASKDRDDRRIFTATVKPVSASVEGAREAGRYEGIKYCISEYGTSDIQWVAGPDAEPQTWTLDGDTAVFKGICRK